MSAEASAKLVKYASLAFVAACLLVGLTGCLDRPGGGALVSVVGSESRLPQTSQTRLGGRTVDHYGRALLDGDLATSLEAAQSLRHMGPESLRWFYKGLTSNVTHVVEHSVCFFPHEDARPYLDVFEPVLLPLLADKNASTWACAAGMLVTMRSEKGIERVRQMSRDPALSEADRQSLAATLKRAGL